jgi:hypothetical protein
VNKKTKAEIAAMAGLVALCLLGAITVVAPGFRGQRRTPLQAPLSAEYLEGESASPFTGWEYQCDQSVNYVNAIHFHEVIVSDGLLPTYGGGRSSYSAATQHCSALCSKRIRCTGFFIQQRSVDQRETCGFYSDPLVRVLMLFPLAQPSASD